MGPFNKYIIQKLLLYNNRSIVILMAHPHHCYNNLFNHGESFKCIFTHLQKYFSNDGRRFKGEVHYFLMKGEQIVLKKLGRTKKNASQKLFSFGCNSRLFIFADVIGVKKTYFLSNPFISD